MSELSTEEFYRALAKLGVRMAREKVRVQDVLQQHLRSLPRVREAAFPGCPGSPAVTVHKLSLADMRDALQAFGGLSPGRTAAPRGQPHPLCSSSPSKHADSLGSCALHNTAALTGDLTEPPLPCCLNPTEELTVVCKHVTLWPKNSRG
ncbi:unnamed protein product, partial [Chrysoparadoxa australica]